MTTLSERLRTEFPGASGRSMKQWLTSGRVRVNARVVSDPRVVVAPGDRVTLGPAAASPARPDALPLGLEILHEDRQLLVIDKPPGLLTIATEKERERTAYRILWDLLSGRRPAARPFIVHRLDRETSGLLVVAKTPGVKTALQAQFAAHTVERTYLAVVEARVRRPEGTITTRLLDDAPGRVRETHDPRRGRPAVTRWRVRRAGAHRTLLEVRLETGRRNQIRAHLAGLGHPIAGDATYGSRTDPFGRLALHAHVLGFDHPRTGARLRFVSPPPAALAKP